MGVAFFGINRSLQHTADSIRRHLLNPLILYGYQVDLYYHTYNLTSLQNARSNEIGVQIDPNGFRQLGEFTAFEISCQERFLQAFDLQSWIVNNIDPWNDGFSSLKNLACQLNSIERCCNMIEESWEAYEFVIFARPDMVYFNSLDIKRVHELIEEQNIWILPSFENFPGRWNDRFIIARPASVGSWCHRVRFGHLFASALKKSVHAESLVKFVADLFGVKMRSVDLRMARVRATGRIDATFDQYWLAQWNLSSWFNHQCIGSCMI